jgi:hypothetical protein
VREEEKKKEKGGREKKKGRKANHFNNPTPFLFI